MLHSKLIAYLLTKGNGSERDRAMQSKARKYRAVEIFWNNQEKQ